MSRNAVDPKFKEAFGARLSLFLDSEGIDISSAAALLEVTGDLVYKARRGEALIGLDKLVLLAISPGITNPCNLHWLCTGSGQMFLDPAERATIPPDVAAAVQQLARLLDIYTVPHTGPSA